MFAKKVVYANLTWMVKSYASSKETLTDDSHMMTAVVVDYLLHIKHPNTNQCIYEPLKAILCQSCLLF